MSGSLLDMLLRLSPRERGLLGLMTGVALPLGIGFAVLLPLYEARQAAEADREEAVALQAWVAARAGEAQGLAQSVIPDQAYEPIGLSGIEEGLIAANLRGALTSIGTESGGVIALRFDSVDFVRLATWLSSAHPSWGYTIQTLRLEDIGAPSKVSARIELSPAR
ncbi:type II secretion system protein GspM [Pacificoceanicola onchidii]|uniref:type II secretion system protein GspM n=1 Tax=Pacificoceanicola onchidii TaxID=2562685 RepID=UPI0010A4C695|nr:type II secretion system protein GspM [Pacificoceanicola onchidii]